MVELSATYPDHSNFDGFDISSVQFRSDLPDNVRLHIADVKQPFPLEFHRQFDMIHLRLLVAGMDKEDWAKATVNLLQLLKPHGAIQWEEADFITGRRLRGGAAGTTAKNLAFGLQPMVDLFTDRYKYGYSTLPEVFRAAGMKRVEQDIVSSDRLLENRALMGRLSIEAVFGWARKERMKGNGDFWPGNTLEDVETRAYEDLKHGAYAQFDIYNTIGFKNA